MKKVYIVEKVTTQSQYTEPKYYASARDAKEILFVDTDEEKARAYMDTLELYEDPDDDDGEDPFYYCLIAACGTEIEVIAVKGAEDAQC